MSFLKDYKEMLSEGGVLSSKRWIANKAINCVLVVYMWLALSDGGTEVVKDITQTLVICVCAMLGVAAFTKYGHSGEKKEEKKEDE